MLDTTGVIAVGVMLFIVTNIDDLALLIAFFADRRMRAVDVVVGQYVGLAVLVLLSFAAARASLLLPQPYIGLFGLVPIGLGIRMLYEDEDDEKSPTTLKVSSALRTSLAVAGITIANGADNIGVYTPVFAVRSNRELWMIVAIFALMTALWCGMSHWLVNHRTAGDTIRKVASAITPYALIGVGIWVMYEANTISLFT